jgi:hypothetical protein
VRYDDRVRRGASALRGRAQLDRRRCALALLVATTACLVENPRWHPLDASTTTGGSDSGGEPLPLGCEPLPAAADAIAITPADAAQLPARIAAAAAADTFVLAPGEYAITDAIVVQADGVTIRSATGEPDDVWLDGGGGAFDLVVVRADNVTIAELGLRRSGSSLVAVVPDTASRSGTVVHRVVFRDAEHAALRVDANPDGPFFADDGTVACSDFGVTDEARAATITCERQAIEVVAGAGWTMRDNHVEGFWCPSENYIPSVRFQHGARDTVVERNVFVDNWRTLMIGNSGPPGATMPACTLDLPEYRAWDDASCGSVYWGHLGGTIRNNLVWIGGAGISAIPGIDAAISLWCVCGTDVFHNTVVNTIDIYDSIEWRFDRSQLRVANNYCTDRIYARDPAAAQLTTYNASFATPNVFVAPLAPPPDLDLHLAPGIDGAIDKGVVLPAPGVPEDFDHDARDATPDLGADEWVP